jgi:hypothetical protein
MNHKTAKEYVALGFSLLPVHPATYPDIDQRKKPVTSLLPGMAWTPLQQRKPTDAELLQWFGNDGNDVALIGGAVSGGLCCVDIDTKADISGHLLEDFEKLVILECPDIYSQLTRQKTVSGGEHYLFRTPGKVGNIGRAFRWGVPGRPGEINEKTGKPKKIKLIETKGEGGFFLVSPSQGYSFLSGDLNSIPVLTTDEVETIFTIARSFDQIPQEQKPYIPAQREFKANDLTPWDDYNQRATIADVLQCLEGAGWIPVPKGEGYRLRRPGASTGTHASLNQIAALPNFFHCFTDSAAPFEGGKTYSPFAVLALCQYGGDFSKAARELHTQGYGKKSAAQNDTRNTPDAAKNIETIPAIVWGAHYIEHGIPDRKPELIGGILRQSHKMLIGAPSKACKSFLAIRLALAIAGGHDWLPGFSCKQGKVYLVNFEIDDGSYMHRVQAVADALQWPMSENIAYHHLRGYARDIEELFPAIGTAIEGHDFSAAILDPQYKLLRSSVIRNFSENDSASMGYLYGELDRYFSRKNTSPVMISHFAKGSASGKESIDRIVGSGAPMRDVDAVCTLTPLDVDNAYQMEFSLREFKAPEPIALQWEYPIHTVDPMLEGVPLKRPGRPGATTGGDDALILNTVVELQEKATQSAVRAVKPGGMSKGRILDALNRLVVSGKLNIKKGEKNANIYQIT